MYPNPYFSAAYFAKSYFASSEANSEPTEPLPSALLDVDSEILECIASKLMDTGEFASVSLMPPAKCLPFHGDSYPYAVVVPIRWTERNSDDPISSNLEYEYNIYVGLRLVDCGERVRRINRLTRCVQHVVHGNDFSRDGIPVSTRIQEGRFDPDLKTPEVRVILSGSFSYPRPRGTPLARDPV